jgi:hypothetical protein
MDRSRDLRKKFAGGKTHFRSEILTRRDNRQGDVTFEALERCLQLVVGQELGKIEDRAQDLEAYLVILGA